jgi:Protein of unknown function (DUF551)
MKQEERIAKVGTGDDAKKVFNEHGVDGFHGWYFRLKPAPCIAGIMEVYSLENALAIANELSGYNAQVEAELVEARAEIERLKSDLDVSKRQWAVMARAVGNWRDLGTPTNNENAEKDWAVAAKAIVEVERLREAITAQSDGWISVKEGLPEVASDLQSSKMLLTYACSPHRRGVSLGRYSKTQDGKGFQWTHCFVLSEDVTHWRELPEPPQTGGES